MKTRLLVTLLAVTAFAFNAPLLAAGDVKTELNNLVAKISARLKTPGARTEVALASELAQFDALLAAHRGDTSDDVAQILFMKGQVYQILGAKDKAIAVFKQMKADFPQSKQAGQVDSIVRSIEIQREFSTGKIFPDFDEKDLSGQPLSIAGHHGKIVLLDFWATWCGPCVAELPNVVAAYKKYHARGFDIIGISLDRARDRQKLINFTKDHEMPWQQFFDGKEWDNKLSTRYGIKSIPATFLLDGDGKIIAQNLRGPALEAELAKRLK